MKSNPIPQLTLRQEELFLAKIRMTSDCWEWTGSRNPHGYGKVKLNGTTFYAHRISYTLFMGDIPEGLVIDHGCRNTGCVKPTHLFAVTQQKNLWRGVRHRQVS